MLNNCRKAVGFFAHTDDEMVAAGTLRRLVRQGCEVHVVTFAPAATEDDRTGGEPSLKIVVPEWNHSLDLIGVAKTHRHLLACLPSSQLPSYRQEICQYVYDFCEREHPEVAFLLSPDDENPAHAVVGIEGERVMRGRVPMTIRCQFPWNYSLGRPNLYVRLDEDDLKVKKRVIQAYRSQLFRYRYEEMLLAYCKADGLSVKVEAAEKFELIRSVV